MEVRNITTIESISEHGGAVRSWIMFEKKKDELSGGIRRINEFDVMAGGSMEPHSHNFEEFYYVLYGKGVIHIDEQKREEIPGDLIRIPPNAVNYSY